MRVTYRYQTSAGERVHTQGLASRDFHGNIATYEINAPGLVRCTSLTIAYRDRKIDFLRPVPDGGVRRLGWMQVYG